MPVSRFGQFLHAIWRRSAVERGRATFSDTSICTKLSKLSSCLHRASIVSKTLIVPTDAHYYEIIEILKQYKITILGASIVILNCFNISMIL